MTEQAIVEKEWTPCRTCGDLFLLEPWLVDRPAYNQCNPCRNVEMLNSEHSPVGPGWMPIVKQLHEDLVKLYPSYRIAQIKEKFGTLSYYCDGVDEDGWKLISAAAGLSARTCETCGKPGLLRKRAWLKTLCNEHSDEPIAVFPPPSGFTF